MIGKHMSAAIQKTGDLIGATGQKLALTKYEQEEQTRREAEKERIRQQERAEDRAWEGEKLDRQLTVRKEMAEARQAADTAKTIALESGRERRHAESLAAQKENALARIAANKEIAGMRGDSSNTISLSRQIGIIENDIKNLEGRASQFGIDPAESEKIRAEIESLQAEKQDLLAQGVSNRNPKPAAASAPSEESPATGSKGLIGSGMGALRPGDTSAKTGDNAPVKVSTQAEWEALEPGTIYIAPDGQKRVKR